MNCPYCQRPITTSSHCPCQKVIYPTSTERPKITFAPPTQKQLEDILEEVNHLGGSLPCPAGGFVPDLIGLAFAELLFRIKRLEEIELNRR